MEEQSDRLPHCLHTICSLFAYQIRKSLGNFIIKVNFNLIFFVVVNFSVKENLGSSCCL